MAAINMLFFNFETALHSWAENSLTIYEHQEGISIFQWGERFFYLQRPRPFTESDAGCSSFVWQAEGLLLVYLVTKKMGKFRPFLNFDAFIQHIALKGSAYLPKTFSGTHSQKIFFKLLLLLLF